MKKNSRTGSIYFGHSKNTYGTSQELQELEFLKKIFPKTNIICPNTTVGELSDFKDYLHIVDCCTLFIASEVEGSVGKGLFCEIGRAFSINIPVFVLRKSADDFYLLPVIGIETKEPNYWKEKYVKLIVK
jgi:hypothetical protein